MKYELPAFARMSKKEEQEISERLNTRIGEISKSFLSGLFFFITVPISIYKKLKKQKEMGE